MAACSQCRLPIYARLHTYCVESWDEPESGETKERHYHLHCNPHDPSSRHRSRSYKVFGERITSVLVAREFWTEAKLCGSCGAKLASSEEPCEWCAERGTVPPPGPTPPEPSVAAEPVAGGAGVHETAPPAQSAVPQAAPVASVKTRRLPLLIALPALALILLAGGFLAYRLHTQKPVKPGPAVPETSTREAQTVQPAETAPPAPAKTREAPAVLRREASTAPSEPAATKVSPAEVPSGPRFGKLVWSGKINRNTILTIEGNRAVLGAVEGELPGLPVTVEVEPREITVVEPPSAQNRWKRLILRTGQQRVTHIEITWSLVPRSGR